ncbi:MAG: Holliday junction branch migration DNA helicase RuvB [Puniceicoccales bacterium]|jgi:Holliday junction DNA helicase RuvB|nr:Holliday junction branch migration DNA helicase RuvB [Puniceicoccales bacterium]
MEPKLSLKKAAEAAVDPSLRPKGFDDFIGQRRTLERLRVMTGAARRRGESLRHVLLSGPPGLGKTTLAMILGREMGTQTRITSGPVIEKASDLAGLLTSLEPGHVLFIDEIHRLPRAVEEYLYSAMEDFCIDILIDQGPQARSIRLDLPRFTLVGATTRTGLLTPPLRSRFTLQTRLGYYEVGDLTQIVRRSARLLPVEIDQESAEEIARRSRGTPRIANNLLGFVRDYCQQRESPSIGTALTREALELLEIDASGLDEMDKQILNCLAENYNGGPVGIGTLAAAIGEDRHTLEEVHEPYLVQEGYLQRTPQGRLLSAKAWEKLGLEPLSRVSTQSEIHF